MADGSPHFRFYPRDFLASVMEWDAAEVGHYIRLLSYQWDHGSIPASPAEWDRISPGASNHGSRLAPKFVHCADNRLRNARMETEREKLADFIRSQKSKGKLSAQARVRKRLLNRGSNPVDPSVDHPVEIRLQPEAQPKVNLPECLNAGMPECLDSGMPEPEPIQPPLPPPAGGRGAGRSWKAPRPAEPEPEIPASIDTPAFRAAWDGYREHRGAKFTARAKRLALAKLAGWGERKAIEALEASVMAGWKGLFEPRAAASNHASDPQARREAQRAREFPEPTPIIVPRINP